MRSRDSNMDDSHKTEASIKNDNHTSYNAYALDNKDRIVMINGQWDDFARENNGINIYVNDIRGNSIWQYISGDPTKMWFDVLLQRVKLKKISIERPYRCDSPDLKRHMKMQISYKDDLLVIENFLLYTEKRQRPIYIQHATTPQHRSTKLRCSICGRIQYQQQWQEPNFLPLTESFPVNVTYAVCEECNTLLPKAAPEIPQIPL